MIKEADMRLSSDVSMCRIDEKHIFDIIKRRNQIFRTQEDRLCRGYTSIGELRIRAEETREGVVTRHNRLTSGI